MVRWAVPGPSMVVNLTGCLALGWVVGRVPAGAAGDRARAFWAVGFLGAYTTMSAFAVEVDQWLADSRWALAVGYAAASVVGGLLAYSLGRRLGEAGAS